MTTTMTTTRRNERASDISMQLKLTTKTTSHLKKKKFGGIRNITMQHLEFPQQQQQQQQPKHQNHKHNHKRARTQAPTPSSPFASVLALSSSSRLCHLNAFPTPKNDGRVIFFESSR
jgi:hypothetical protein